MPTEPLAALVYIFMLVPGIVFVHKSEMHRPTIRRSIFRETSAVIVVSAVCFAAVALVAFIWSFFDGEVANLFYQFLTSPDALLKKDPQLLVAVVLSSLLIATAVGFSMGTKGFQSGLDQLMGGADAINRTHSGWAEAFELYPAAEVVVGVQLKSGTWVQGQMYTYNPLPHDDPDRSLTLTGNIRYRTQNMDETASFEGLTMLIIQASEIDFLAVGHNEPVQAGNEELDGVAPA